MISLHNMNTKILQKVLAELEKATPSLDYARGMIETLIEMDVKPTVETYIPPAAAMPLNIFTKYRCWWRLYLTLKLLSVRFLSEIGVFRW